MIVRHARQPTQVRRILANAVRIAKQLPSHAQSHGRRATYALLGSDVLLQPGDGGLRNSFMASLKDRHTRMGRLATQIDRATE